MRTTLTLDPDVAAMLKRAMQKEPATLKETINRALRAGLQADAAKPTATPYRMKTLDVGRLLINIECVGDALAYAEGEDYK
jgi:hypothetical protein